MARTLFRFADFVDCANAYIDSVGKLSYCHRLRGKDRFLPARCLIEDGFVAERIEMPEEESHPHSADQSTVWSKPVDDVPITESPDVDRGKLVLTGACMMLLAILGMIDCLYAMFLAAPISPAGNSAGYEAGQAIGEMLRGPVALAMNSVVLIGGFSLFRRESWGVAVAGSAVSLAPCTSIFCISIPVGLWALYLLHRPGAQAAFRSASSIASKPHEEDVN